MSVGARVGDSWNPGLYVGSHSFVYELGESLVELAGVREGERALDAGCGTGQLTAMLAERGAEVQGIDRSPSMVEAARRAHPQLDFEVGDILALDPSGDLDLVFSNATLHWVKPPEEAARRIAGALKPGGRLVAELGGAGNVDTVDTALLAALAEAGIPEEALGKPRYYPSVAEYAEILAGVGLEVELAHLFQRPTPLEGPDGLRNWLEMFIRPYLIGVPQDEVDALLDRATELARPELLIGDTWYADYVRLRVVARKPPSDAKRHALAALG